MYPEALHSFYNIIIVEETFYVIQHLQCLLGKNFEEKKKNNKFSLEKEQDVQSVNCQVHISANPFKADFDCKTSREIWHHIRVANHKQDKSN